MPKRVIYLVRHGQREPTAPANARLGGLSAVGREQAQRIAARMEGLPLTAIHSSTLPRAIETAAAIAIHHPGLHVRRWNDLCECLPGRPAAYKDYLTDIPELEYAEGLAQAEAAFTRFFRPARRGEEHIALVCHGNLIRFLACRSIGAPTAGWANLDVNNTGLSRVVVEDGRMVLLSFNDVGHLPLEMQTFI